MNNSPFKYLWIALPIAILFFGLFYLYSMELDWLANTIDVRGLLTRAAVIGGLLSQVVAYLIARKQDELITKFQIHVGLFIVFCIFSPFFSSYLNRNLQATPAVYESAKLENVSALKRTMVETMEGFEMKAEGYLLEVEFEGKYKRFRLKNMHFEENQSGDIIQLPLRKGAFGYKFLVLE